jgi:hypothetical protein
MKKILFLLVAVLSVNISGYGQGQFPFNSENNTSSILAYWYNCKPDSVTIASLNETAYFNSSLQIYGPVISDSFSVAVEVFLSDSSLAYSNKFTVKKGSSDKSYQVVEKNKYFRIISTVAPLGSNPDKIKVTIHSPETQMEKWISCKYHKIFGHMTDFKGNPLRSFISVKPDAFEDASSVWSDNQGYYEITLPERTYNCFYVNDGNYKSTTLEAWAWHMIIDKDQELDFKIGTGEVYNLNVWPNNGGYNSLLLSFRPMVLGDRSNINSNITINDKQFNLINIAPVLDIKDMKITINGNQAEIYSMQKYFETGKDMAMPAYMIQIRRLAPTFGKQTIRVEYDKSIELNGRKIFQNSMGYFQFNANYSGSSVFN